MKKRYSYHDCYRVLGTKPDSSWTQLRNAYKKSIQKWHPDRFKDGTPEKLAAEDKIKAITIAYKQIHQYYLENGSMPIIEEVAKVVSVETANKSTVNSKSTSSTIPKKTHTATKPPLKDSHKKSSKRLVTALMLASLYPLYYIFTSSSDFEQQYNADYKVEEIDPQNIQPPIMTDEKAATTSYLQDKLSQKKTHNENQPSEKASTHDHALMQGSHFTNGSTFADVIGTQGAPTRTDGNIWFYGKSEIHFKEGKVSHWVRSTRNPLKAQMTINK